MSKSKPTLEELKQRIREYGFDIDKFQKAFDEADQELIESMLGDLGNILVGVTAIATGLNPLIGGFVGIAGKLLVMKYGD